MFPSRNIKSRIGLSIMLGSVQEATLRSGQDSCKKFHLGYIVYKHYPDLSYLQLQKSLTGSLGCIDGVVSQQINMFGSEWGSGDIPAKKDIMLHS